MTETSSPTVLEEGGQSVHPNSARGRAQREMREWASHGLTSSEVRILDLLIERQPISPNDLFPLVAHTFTGRHAVIAALAAGEVGPDDQLARAGRHHGFVAAIQRLKDRQAVEEDTEGLLRWTGTTPAMPDGSAYRPGAQALVDERFHVNQRILEALPHYGGFGGLFPRMSDEELDALADDMRVHGFDPDQPILMDDQTGEVIDGYNRREAATRAGITDPPIVRRQMDPLQRLELSLRHNLHRRNLTRPQRDRIMGLLRRLGLTTRRIAELLATSQRTVSRATSSDNESIDSITDNVEPAPHAWPTNSRGPRGPWTSLAQREEAENLALDLAGQRIRYDEIGRRLQERYHLDRPLASSNVGDMVRRARARQPESPLQPAAQPAPGPERALPAVSAPSPPAPVSNTPTAPTQNHDPQVTSWDELASLFPAQPDDQADLTLNAEPVRGSRRSPSLKTRAMMVAYAWLIGNGGDDIEGLMRSRNASRQAVEAMIEQGEALGRMYFCPDCTPHA